MGTIVTPGEPPSNHPRRDCPTCAALSDITGRTIYCSFACFDYALVERALAREAI